MKGCVSALFVVALYIVILVGCDFGILAAILTIVAFYGLFELLTRESPDQKDEKSAENPNFKISGSGSKDTMSPLDQSWDMHISSGIFGSDDFSGFSGFGKGKDGGEQNHTERKKIFENGGTNRHLSTNVIKLKMKRDPQRQTHDNLPRECVSMKNTNTKIKKKRNQSQPDAQARHIHINMRAEWKALVFMQRERNKKEIYRRQYHGSKE